MRRILIVLFMLSFLPISSDAQRIAKGIYLGMSKSEFNRKANPDRLFISQEYYYDEKYKDLTYGDYFFIKKHECVFKNGKLHTLVLESNLGYVTDTYNLHGASVGKVGVSKRRILNWLNSKLGNKVNISITSYTLNHLSYQCYFVVKISKK